MTRFLLADNPMHPEQSGVWVIHVINPLAMIQCIEGHVEVTDRPYAQFSFNNSDGIVEYWTLSAHHFFTTDFLTNPEEQVQPLLRKTWRWYRSYLELDR